MPLAGYAFCKLIDAAAPAAASIMITIGAQV
jgi:hypothetical protein